MSTARPIQAAQAPGPATASCASLAYPLNVYAQLLEWKLGKAEHLHYGHFAHPGEGLGEAQRRAVALLRSHLPPSGRILEVGCGFGWLTHELQQSGYDVTGITPDEAQLRIGRARYGEDLPVRCCRLEEFAELEGQWDGLVFHESAQYVPVLELFERASALLKPTGEILVLDEFARRRTEPGRENLHHKDHFLALAKRYGFVCTEEADCTEAVLPTLDFLVEEVQSNRSALAGATGVDTEALDALGASNRSYRAKYLEGRYGYFLLRLRRQSVPRWHLAKIREQDQPAVEALFSEVFADAMPLDFWRWKYAPGRGEAVGLWQDGALVAHYGGTVRSFHHRGSCLMGSQSCDVMVAPRLRGEFLRQGPFFLVAATFLEQFLGYGTPNLIAYGFPNERAFRLPFKLGLYTEPVTQVREVSWAADRTSSTSGMIRELDPRAARDGRLLDRLWRRMAHDMGHLIVGVRDASFWRTRYQEHPKHAYRLVLVRHRWLRTPLAALALKDEGDRLELLDWVAGASHIPQVVEAATRIARDSGRQAVYLWASDPVIDCLQGTHPAVRDLNILVPTNAWTDSPAYPLLKDRLWLTGGDTDFH